MLVVHEPVIVGFRPTFSKAELTFAFVYCVQSCVLALGGESLVLSKTEASISTEISGAARNCLTGKISNNHYI